MVKEQSCLLPSSVPEGHPGEERLVYEKPELTASPWAMAELVSLCQLSVSSGGFNTRVMKSAEKKPFLKPSTSTRSPSIRGPKFKPLPCVEKGDILSEITVEPLP